MSSLPSMGVSVKLLSGSSSIDIKCQTRVMEFLENDYNLKTFLKMIVKWL
jgi:hypothetical protein